MKEPYWFTREECLTLHDLILSHYGGITGVCDENMLESALAKQQQRFHYGKPILAELGVAYTEGIVKSHRFLDGNKRTGSMMGAGFPERNGFEFHAPEAEAVVGTMALEAGELTEAGYAGWMAANSKHA